jgi:nickel transport protein
VISILSLSGLLASPGVAAAHSPVAEFRVLPGKRVQVEAWFDVTKEPLKDAKVTVLQSSELLTDGKMNENGIFVFPFEKAEAMRIVIDAGAGHRAELRVTAADLGGDIDPALLIDRATRITVKDVLLGVTFVLAAAAFILSIRNARRLAPPADPPSS